MDGSRQLFADVKDGKIAFRLLSQRTTPFVRTIDPKGTVNSPSKKKVVHNCPRSNTRLRVCSEGSDSERFLRGNLLKSCPYRTDSGSRTGDATPDSLTRPPETDTLRGDNGIALSQRLPWKRI